MKPFIQIFPGNDEGVTYLQLLKKTGSIPKGDYFFIEAYCTEKGCDCRRVTVFVVNGKGKGLAAIEFGFDPQAPLSGPFLADIPERRAIADELLEMFVSRINQDEEWLKDMYERYRTVRQRVDGRKYRGKPFPLPGAVRRVPAEPPGLPEILKTAELQSASKRSGAAQGNLFGNLAEDASEPRQTMAELVDRFTRMQQRGLAALAENEHFIRTEVLPDLVRYEELAALLPKLIPRNAREEARMQAALELLRALFEMLRHEMEAGRPKTGERVEKMQNALARHVFGEKGDLNLAAHVTRILLDTRVEILPVLREANQQRFVAMGEQGSAMINPSFKGLSMGSILRKAGCQNPFEGVEVLLDTMILLDEQVQLALCRELLDSRDSFVRDTGALMAFHPHREVREGVAALMASGSVRAISPETLRRLIISRNWFPPAKRDQIDAAITSARRNKVSCAQLAPPVDCVIKASTIDGAGAQSFFITAGKSKRRILCNILWKQGQGVIDSFVGNPNAQDLKMLMNGIPENLALREVAPMFLQRIACHALAVGNDAGKPPSLGLLQVAEALGCDKWRADLLNPEQELSALRIEMERVAPQLLGKTQQREALQESGCWPEFEAFADTWFEDDIAVDEIIQATQKSKKLFNRDRLARLIADEILEARRVVWSERLVLMALWLRDSVQSPIPWHHMFHLAEAVAGSKPLRDIPLMLSIAEVSVLTALERGISHDR